MKRGKGKKFAASSPLVLRSQGGVYSSNASHDIGVQQPASFAGDGTPFTTPARKSLSLAHADPHSYVSSTHQVYDIDSNSDNGVSREETEEDARGAALPCPPDLEDREQLHVVDGELEPYKEGKWVRCASVIARNHFKGPWVSWKKVPKENKQDMWKEFLQYYKFSTPEEETAAFEIWHKSSGLCLKGALYHARAHAKEKSGHDEADDSWKDYPPNWIEKCIWVKLVDMWKSSGWKKQHTSGKANRQKGGEDGSYCKHTGGSIKFKEWDRRMREANPNITAIDVFERTHKTKKGSGDWVNPKSQRILERYQELCARKRRCDYSEGDSTGETDIQFDAELFYDAIGGMKKGRTFGVPVSSFEGVIPAKQCGSSSSSMSFTPLITQEDLDARLSQQQEQYEAKMSELICSQQQMQEDMERRQEKMEQQFRRKQREMEQKFQRLQASMMEQMRSFYMSAGQPIQLPFSDPSPYKASPITRGSRIQIGHVPRKNRNKKLRR